jgi:hypothetical protein
MRAESEMREKNASRTRMQGSKKRVEKKKNEADDKLGARQRRHE